MKNLFINLLILLVSTIVFGQELNSVEFNYSEDYTSILKQTKDSTSSLYYETLFNRFQKADSTLTNYELLALQIGYTDNPKYWPYQDIKLEREIWSLNEKSDFELAEKKLDTLLSNNPALV